jgi:hypothetical protein
LRATAPRPNGATRQKLQSALAEVAVEDRAGGRGAALFSGALRPRARRGAQIGERTDQSEGGEVDPDRSQPRPPRGLHEAGDRVAPGRHHGDLHLGAAVLCRPAADHLEVEHRLIERHRQLVLGLEADSCVELGPILDQGQAQGAHRQSLVGDADPHLLCKLVAREQGGEAGAELLGVDDLAVVDGARAEREHGGVGRLRRAVLPDLGCGDAVGLDVEADHHAVLLRRESHHLEGRLPS